MAKKAKSPRDPKGRGPSKTGYDNLQKGKLSPDAELQYLIGQAMGADTVGPGLPSKLSTMQRQLGAMNRPAIPARAMQDAMTPDAVKAMVLQMILGQQAPTGPVDDGADTEPDDDEDD
jgi:hypothetical protein